LTLPAIRADVPHRFAVHGRNDGLAGAALALADTGILCPEHWQGDLREAVSIAISDLAHKHLPNPLADYTLVLAEDTVAADLEYDTSHGYQASRKLPANTRVSALIVTFNLDNLVHRVIGPAIQRMEGAHRGLGQTVLYWLHTAFNHSSSALDPIAGYGWAQYNYWMGENDETAREKEELDYLRAEHENEQKDVPANKRKPFDEAAARQQLQFFRKADYDRAIPPWAGSGFKHHPMLSLEQLACHRRGRFRPYTGLVTRIPYFDSVPKVALITLNISSKLTGFGRNATAPLAIASCLFFSSTSNMPLMTMIGILFVSLTLCSQSMMRKPSHVMSVKPSTTRFS